jgi:molybdate transport system ATP-binding protein
VSLSVDIQLTLGSFELSSAFESFGGITALFGPSGAGKTLTLRAVAGLAQGTRGRIILSNRALLDSGAGVNLPPRSRRIGYVFQQYALFPHLSVEKNIGYGIAALPAPELKERTEKLLELVGLTGMGNRRPAELSGGQQQRVALARALATEPELLLLDEPFAAVDVRMRKRLRAELRRIQEVTGTPMLLVTHDLTEVRQLADYVVLMDQGKVLSSGASSDILGEPLHPLLLELTEEKLV